MGTDLYLSGFGAEQNSKELRLAKELLENVPEPIEYDSMFDDYSCLDCGATGNMHGYVDHADECNWKRIQKFLKHRGEW